MKLLAIIAYVKHNFIAHFLGGIFDDAAIESSAEVSVYYIFRSFADLPLRVRLLLGIANR